MHRDEGVFLNAAAGPFSSASVGRAGRALSVSVLLLLLASGAVEAASYKVGSFTKTIAAAPTPQVVTHGLGVAPKALILWTNSKTNESFSGGAFFGLGMTDGTASASVGAGMQNATGGFYGGGRFASGAALTITDGTTAIAQASLTSWNATNFTLNWTSNDANAYVVHFIAIGGTDVSARLVEWNRAATTGNQSVTTVGFRPDVVFHVEADTTVSGNTSTANVVLGVMDAAGNQWANSAYSAVDTPTDTQRGQSTSACFYWAYNNLPIAHQASFVSMDPNGFTVNHTINDGFAARTFSLALRGVEVRPDSFTKTTAAAPAAQSVNAGLQPQLVLLSSVQDVAATGLVTQARYGLGASDGTSEGSSAFQDQDGVGTSNVDGIDKTSKVFVKVNNATPTIDAEADLTGLTATGFNLNWTTNDAVATQILYLAFGVTTGPNMQVQSGAYAGDSTSGRSIHVGFQPDVVFVKGDADVFGVVRTSTMTGNVTKSLFFGTYPLVDRIQSLDATGFTVGNNPEVNSTGTNYYWVALKAAPGQLKVGFYDGNDADNRSIAGVGFQPDYVMILPAEDHWTWHRYGPIVGDRSMTIEGGIPLPGPGANRIQAFQLDGFQVGNDIDVNDGTPLTRYHYIAVKAVPGRINVGSYVGNGGGSRAITGVGFQPEWAMVSRQQTDMTVHKPASTGISTDSAQWWGGYPAAANSPDLIEALQLDGFQVGSTENGSGANYTYYWVAFGPHPAKAYYRSIGDTTVTHGTAGTTGAGTRVSVTNGSATVGGLLGTTWLASNRGRGDVITIPCDNPPACTLPTVGVHYMIQSVTANNALQLSRGFQGATNPSASYLIRRQFSTLPSWEDCISGTAPACNGYFPVIGGNLVTEDRSEVGIAYKDSVFPAGANVNVVIDGSTTDALHTITLTADAGNRHYGIAGTGVILDGGAATDSAVLVLDDFVTVEWLEIRNGGSGFDGVEWQSLAAVNKGVARNLLVHGLPDNGIQIQDSSAIVDIYDNIVYRNGGGFRNVSALGTGSLRIFNNTIFGNGSAGGITANVVAPGLITLRNNISHGNTGGDFNVPSPNPASSHNLAGDATGITHSPGGGGLDSIGLPAMLFVSTTLGSENLHIQTGSAAANVAADLSNVFSFDIDGAARVNPWDIGADDILATTAVDLLSFEARPFDGAVELSWETGSELENLGFHVCRGSSASGPWERLTTNLIPGLGSSPEGARYVYRDSTVSNGTTYYYLLEDVETTGRVERHGPVEASPNAQASVVDPTLPPAATTYGDPYATLSRVLSRNASEMRVELTTGGFYAFPWEDGTVDIEVPGFTPSKESPGLPVKLHWLEAVAGRKVDLVSVRATDVQALSLAPSGSASSELEASWDGTQRLRRSRGSIHPFAANGLVPKDAARVAEIAFQGDVKKALLELAPLRWDGATGRLLFARKLLVTLSFRNRDPSDTVTAGGRRGRRERETAASRGIVARLSTTEPGLHGVRYEDVFRETRGRGVDAGALRLSRLGKAVAFHLEPPTDRFAPGSTLYFLSEGADANPYGNEAVYELETGRAGERMRTETAAPAGKTLLELQATIEREEDRYYQAALLDAPDLWLWDMLLAPSVKVFPFSLSSLAASGSPAKLEVWLQGASDFPESPDHHARLFVNGTSVGDEEWDGKEPRHIEIALPPGILREGGNSLEIESLQDTGALYSMFFLDRFAVTYPRLAVAAQGVASGRWDESGTAEVSALGARARVLDVTEAAPRWLTGARYDAGTLRFRVEAGRSYLVVDSASVKRPEVRKAAAARWKSNPPRADYLAIGPRELLDAARPLLDLRRSQGLAVASVPIDEVFDEMGYGERRPEAIRDFLTYAYHHWPGGIRYVLLLGDASYDFKDHLGTGAHNQVPALPIETSYLWTASDPTLAAVNGDDFLPDVAIGRLPAADASELLVMIDKILAYETAGRGLSAPVVLVTDNPDLAGDFDAGALDLMTSVLASRSVRNISLSALGAERTRESILEAFDEGASVVSYMGHGGIHLWASENIFSNDSVALLAPQGQQPIVNALDCLNGYFHFPFFDSLAEELLKADGKGAVAVFAPSGLSLNEPAHELHKALLRELLEGEHARLGDAVLAAQAKFLETGSFAELLAIYHLFGDPALRLE